VGAGGGRRGCWRNVVFCLLMIFWCDEIFVFFFFKNQDSFGGMTRSFVVSLKIKIVLLLEFLFFSSVTLLVHVVNISLFLKQKQRITKSNTE
jgi:hypothetical protein